MDASESQQGPTVVTKREKELAEGCDLTVITEASPVIHLNGMVSDAARRVFGIEAQRYDLLSVPSIKHVLKQQEWIDVLATDVMTALALHKAEKLLVATMSVQPRILIQQLKEYLHGHGPRIRGFTLQRPRLLGSMTTLVIGCMDYRLRGPTGFGPRLAERLGNDAFGILATAGAAKELGTDTPRTRMVLAQLELAKDLRRVVLCSHTDCGKYDARRTFKGDAGAEKATLIGDLNAARDNLRARFPRLRIDTMIASVRNDRCVGLIDAD